MEGVRTGKDQLRGRGELLQEKRMKISRIYHSRPGIENGGSWTISRLSRSLLYIGTTICNYSRAEYFWKNKRYAPRNYYWLIIHISGTQSTRYRCSWPLQLSQPSHLQKTPHLAPALKHSQYFFKHRVFLHLHPFFTLSNSTPNLNMMGFSGFYSSKAFGFLDRASIIALVWYSLFYRFPQPLQLQFSPQKICKWKHSQYIFRQLDFLQLHPVCRTLSIFSKRSLLVILVMSTSGWLWACVWFCCWSWWPRMRFEVRVDFMGSGAGGDRRVLFRSTEMIGRLNLVTVGREGICIFQKDLSGELSTFSSSISMPQFDIETTATESSSMLILRLKFPDSTLRRSPSQDSLSMNLLDSQGWFSSSSATPTASSSAELDTRFGMTQLSLEDDMIKPFSSLERAIMLGSGMYSWTMILSFLLSVSELCSGSRRSSMKQSRLLSRKKSSTNRGWRLRRGSKGGQDSTM